LSNAQAEVPRMKRHYCFNLLMRSAFPAAVIATILSNGCTVGPNYKRASAPEATKWDVAEPWREGAPKDGVPKGEWWNVFHDDDLNALEKQALSANQTIKVSLARLEQARASAAVQISTEFPTLGTTPSGQRQKLSANRPTGGVPTIRRSARQNVFLLPFTVNYEVDLFGRRRRSIEAAEAAYQANAADLGNIQLLVESQLAGDYFNLRQLDSELGILNRTVESLQRGLQLVNSRHQGGVASGLDVAQEETLLESTQTQAILLQQQRKQFEDAIATLMGRPAPEFHIASKVLNGAPPPIDPGLPSDLLERRPDIAEAERQMAVANAQIGVAKAAYYPSLSLFGQGGWQSADIAKLADVGSTFWAVGANVAEPIFSGGLRHAQAQFAQAGYEANVASYRETVLGAFQEVQDDITASMVLSQAEESQQRAVDAARRTLDISTSRYSGGLVSYLDVVTAQQNLLNNERQLAAIQGQRLVTSVLLTKALGGGWDAASLAAVRVKPKPRDIITP
jgi:NodT family efflux transporter outer membrane factor (OMF) lipoprotein